jgi:3-phosphoshikimate 1-carboxyvinyltransferase
MLSKNYKNISLLIKPSLLKGKITIPPSKSLSHRAIICASLSMEESNIKNIVFSDDIRATIEGMKTLGADIKEDDDFILVKKSRIIENNIVNSVIDCNESGSTLRFLIPLSLVLKDGCTFTGKGRLSERPLDVYYDIFKKSNIKYETNKGKLPLKVRGRLKGGSYNIPGNVSSQFITGLFFALPLLEVDSKIKVTGVLESKSYIDLTLAVMKKYNVNIEKIDEHNYHIKGAQKYKAFDYRVEGDFSQAAFFLAANVLGCKIEYLGLNYNSMQGDKEILSIIEKYSSPDREITIDASQIPDLVPVISVIASLKENCTTNIINAGRLRFKESDRLEAMASEMKKIGASIKETKNGLIIKGKGSLCGNTTVNSRNDHRIAMALAIAAIKCENPIILEGYESVKKTYPKFWDDYQSLGGVINEFNDRK